MSLESTRQRALATRNAQHTLVEQDGWAWEEKTVADWDADLKSLNTRESDESAARAALRAANAGWDANVVQIAVLARAIVRLAKTRFRHDPARLRPFQAINTRGSSREKIYKLGLAARDAWQQHDSTWVPLKDAKKQDVTLAKFSALLKTCKDCETVQSAELTAWRTAAATLNTQVAALDHDCVAWYADATTHFPTGTALGDMLRSAVPTTTQPQAGVGQPVLTNLMAAAGTIHFDCLAPHATHYTYFHQPPGATAFAALPREFAGPTVTLLNQPPGRHRFKAIGSNTHGHGPISAIAEVELAGDTAPRTTTPAAGNGEASRGAAPAPVPTNGEAPAVNP